MVLRKKYYFIEPEFDFHYRLLRMLMILNKTSFNSKGKKLLTLDKIMIYDYLISNPRIYKEVLNYYGIEIVLKYSEQENIESFSYLNFISLDKEYRYLLNIMSANGLIEVEVIERKIYYSISELGRNYVGGFQDGAFNRLNELIQNLIKINTKNVSQIKSLLKKEV